ncbi:phosphotransferase [Acidiferrimicrobium sp. IK]|uniref:phosphotransferase n=1 Tax=Acidiferrimicrobium sp. IK TaxID=2871700 RepID=UPI0021CB17ED|nr:phosphotransferase [Acidiferrimicrobium sp. IK]MCU4187017.1 phosphotransferase [Acidiferrimicrobium sp. IK]
MWVDEVVWDGAKRLRQLHDASVGFAVDGAVWQAPARIPAEVVCHNDFAPHNLVFRDERIAGAIDFDFCSPGPPVWDIAYFATRIVPLTADPPAGGPGMDQGRRRTQLILDAYGRGVDITIDDVIRVAIIRLHQLAQLSRSKADELSLPQLRSDADAYDRDGRFLAAWRS